MNEHQTERPHSLWYGSILIGRIHEPYCSDATWYGRLDRAVRSEDGELSARLVAFIEFTMDWNRRTEADPMRPPSPEEFNAYADLLTSGFWVMKSGGGAVMQIVDAPVFFGEDEMSWRTEG